MRTIKINQVQSSRQASAPRRAAADRIYVAIAEARRIHGDGPFCDVLERLAVETGRNVLRYAAQVINGKTGGRKEKDDRRAIQRIVAWPKAHRHEAVGIVAREMAGPGAGERSIEAIAQRLRGKLRKINEGKGSIRQPVAL